MSERKTGLSQDEILEIAEESTEVFYDGYRGVLFAASHIWTIHHSMELKHEIVVPTAILGINWSLEQSPYPQMPEVDLKATELASDCDLSMLERMEVTQYNIDGLREGLLIPTISDAARIAINRVSAS
jgi:hypothetical protein